MVRSKGQIGKARALVARMSAARSARAARLRFGLSASLMCLGIHNSAVAQSGVSLVIETYATAPAMAPASRAIPGVNRIAGDSQASGSQAVLNDGHALFAQMGRAGQGGTTSQGAARNAMRLFYDRAGQASFGAGMACGVLDYRPSGMLSANNEETRRVLYPLVWREACRAGVPAGLFDALIIHESRYRVDAVSPKGAIGLTQLMPGTAANLGVDSWTIEDNIRGGARYLRSMLDSFGQYHLALAASNAGPGAVARAGDVPAFHETQAYVGDIIRRWSALAGN